MQQIEYQDFDRVELRVGTIVAAELFREARKPAYKLRVDFGEFGIKSSSAQITVHYQPADLIGRQVVAVINMPTKSIADFKSECLVTGFPDANNNVVLIGPDQRVANGAKLF